MSRRAIDDARVVALTRAGWSAPAIAKELGCNESTVTRARRRNGVAKEPGKPVTEDEIARVTRLLEDGASLQEAARTIGRPRSTLERRFGHLAWTPQQCGQFAMLCRYGAL